MRSLKQQVAERKASKQARLGPFTPTPPYSADVQRVLERLPSKATPQLLQFTDVGASYTGSACHLNVKHRVMTNGGRRVHGWLVWQYPQYAQAEFHSVWQDSQGTVLDITPPRNNQVQVLFVRDDTLRIACDVVTGRDVLYSAITSAPWPWYAVARKLTDSPVYALTIPPGSEVQIAMDRYGLSDLR